MTEMQQNSHFYLKQKR